MRIGITGTSGVLGSILLEKLHKMENECTNFEGDIRNIDEIREWLGLKEIDFVIHLAAMVPPSEVKNNLSIAFDVNSVGTKNLVDVLNEMGKDPWLFYSSTSHVYKSSDKTLSEDDEIEPISEYGLTKFAGEILAKKNYKNLCIGRILSMYHKTQKPPFLYANMLNRIKTEDLNKEFELYGAESLRDFLNAEEIADIIIKLMEKKAVGIYNIASGKKTKVKDFVQSLTEKNLKFKNMGNSDSLVANIDKLEKLLNEK